MRSRAVDLCGVGRGIGVEVLEAAFAAKLHFLAIVSDDDGNSHAAERFTGDGANRLTGSVARVVGMTLVIILFVAAHERERGQGQYGKDGELFCHGMEDGWD